MRKLRKGEKIMAKVISINNHKGGVGKTTTTEILGELLAFLDKKVLLIDNDPQGNLSKMLGQHVDDSDEVVNGLEKSDFITIHELYKFKFREKEQVKSVIHHTYIKNVDIIPATRRHTMTVTFLLANSAGNINNILKKALDTIKDEYDYILIDNAPATDILTVNSFFVTDEIITPVRCESFSYEGLKEILARIAYIKEEHDIDTVNFRGVYITQVEPGTNIYKDIREGYIDELGEKFLDTPIRKTVAVQEIETDFKPLLMYKPNNSAVFDYAELLLALNILSSEDQQKLRTAIGREK